MQVRYTFNIRGHLDVDRKWRYKRGNWTFQFHGEGEFASSLSVTIADVSEEHWPKVVENPEGEVRAELNIRDPYAPYVLAEVNNIAGFLGLFRLYEVETDTVELSWIPESVAEQEELTITKLKKSFDAPLSSPMGKLPPDIISRCVLAARDSQLNLAPLCFFRQGVEDVVTRRYVEAFYDFYFVLETLFADGKVNPTHVLREFLRSPDLCEVVEEMLSNTEDITELRYVDAAKAGDVVEGRDKEEVLSFLIQTRGLLHHHSQKQSQRRFKWDPANQEAYRFAATLAKLISARICWRMIKGELFAESVDLNRVFVYARSEEKFQIRFVYSEGVAEVQRQGREAFIEVPGSPKEHGMPSAAQLLQAEQEFRSRFAGTGRYLISYEAGPADGSRGRFSEYRAYLPNEGN